MGRDQIDRQYEREEERLVTAFNRGDIGREEYNQGMRELQQEAREALREAEADEHERIRNDYGGW
jgi:hypothetical protein